MEQVMAIANLSAYSKDEDTDCTIVNTFNDTATRCLIVQGLNDCQTGRAVLPYINLLYCNEESVYAPLFTLLVWLVALFVALGSTASSYLCPALVVISRSLQLSQSVAGVTFLAFGNGAPDTIATIASIRLNRTALAIGELFGGGTYVATVVVGLIFINNKFDLIQSSLLRDVFFYLGASYWAFVLYYGGSITLSHAACFIVLYLVYIFVAVFGSSVLKKTSDMCTCVRKLVVRSDTASNISTESEYKVEATDRVETPPLYVPVPSPVLRPKLRRSSSGVSLHHHHENAIYLFTTSVEEEPSNCADDFVNSFSAEYKRNACSVSSQASFHLTRSNSSVFPGESTPLLHCPSVENSEGDASLCRTVPRYSEWMELLLQISPVEPEEWSRQHWLCKVYDVVTFPIYLVLVLTIPVVDRENRRNNWCRPLNTLQCVTSPLVIVFLFGGWHVKIADVLPLACLILVLGTILGIVVWCTSVAMRPPRYHVAFAYAGFAVSITWIYGIATEIVSLLKAFGVLYGISDALLGMTVLAWGNNIGDLVTNLSLAKQGFPQMAMSACFAGPVLAMLCGIGVAFTINFTTQGVSVVELQYSNLLAVIYGALVGVLTVLLISTLVTWFRSSRVVGYMLLTLYATFLFITAALEFGFTHIA
ncbi:mitochondrial sodium/calcium exchanger protein-like [Ornithodoros turicata]